MRQLDTTPRTRPGGKVVVSIPRRAAASEWAVRWERTPLGPEICSPTQRRDRLCAGEGHSLMTGGGSMLSSMKRSSLRDRALAGATLFAFTLAFSGCTTPDDGGNQGGSGGSSSATGG